MDSLAPFRIPVATLKSDEASYSWELGPDFLAIFDDEHEPCQGQYFVDMELQRAAGITTLYFEVRGALETTCDRCLVPINMPFSADYQLVVKFGDPSESTDEVVFIDPDAPELNVGNHLYDFILLSIPISHRIPGCEQLENSPCDRTVLNYLAQHPPGENAPGNDGPSPWDDLKKVIDN